ncbi:uncharacterized protein LOC122247993 [Penaeus japonicus]|uniref:uncharacterized protein LOC122247993 n=1 Tax=Penaeus japonicus TaxID=27405 RepID=UPI001C712000|nr:uncharacterized protein LOC122247993 [Penaeus japonicus]
MLSLDATVHLLWLGTPILAGVSGVTVLSAVSGDSWLATREKVPNPAFRNGSSKVEYISKWTTSGLFSLCVTEGGQRDFRCTKIDYFPSEEYNPDPNDSTQAIPYTVLRSVGFFLTAAILLSAAELLCINGHFCRRRRYFTFLAGITFVVAGLFMMLGIVIYIATLKGEVAEKLRPKSTFQEPLFVYAYGWSFLLIIAGFISTEVAGITAIFLYIYWHKRDWSNKQKLLYSPDCIPPLPPACLKHPRQRSYSLHAQMPLLDGAHVRRSRSQQFLECPDSCQNHVEPPHAYRTPAAPPPSAGNHLTPNHISSASSATRARLPPPLILPPAEYPSTPHRVSYPSSPHPQRYAPHAALVDVGGFEGEGDGGFEWRERDRDAELEREHRRRMGRSLTDLPQKGGCGGGDLDRIPLARSGTLPRSLARLSAAPPMPTSSSPPPPSSTAAPNASTSSSSSYGAARGALKDSGGTLPRQRVKAREAEEFLRAAEYEGRERAAAAFPRGLVHRSRSGPIPLGPLEGSSCGVGAGCCGCCSCYCCCCCWREGGASSTPPCTCAPPPRPRLLSLAPTTSWGPERWREDPHLLPSRAAPCPAPCTAPCPASCALAHLSASSPNLKYYPPAAAAPHQQQQRPPPRHAQYPAHYYKQLPAHTSRPPSQYYPQSYRHEVTFAPQHHPAQEGRGRRDDPRLNDPRLNDPRHNDLRHDPRHSDPRHNDPRHSDPRHSDPRNNDPRSHNDPHRHTTPV